MKVNKKLTLEGKAVTVFLEGKAEFPDSFGNIDIDSVKRRKNIVYRSWNIKFTKDIHAEEKDNSGLDEVQIMFNLNQDIEWKVRNNKNIKSENSGKEIENVKMLKGEVCIFRNNNYCTEMKYQADTNFKFKSMQMPTTFFRSLLEKYFSDKNILNLETQFLTHVTKTVITPEMYRVLLEIDTSQRFKEYEGVYLEGKMIELTAMILYGIAYNKTDQIKKSFIPNKKDVKHIEELRQEIQTKPWLEYDAESVASSLGMSVSKLNRIFRNIYATSLHNYVQEKRLEYAAHLIREHGFAISEAARKAGYTNMSHFSKAFEKKFGILPRQYSSSRSVKEIN
ncbi:AraC family transcriptional regulator [Treponema sp.]|uniref:helix-turn-helix domain-containing protein n=1 Tax=Treponema sp. TaxID=166 RepID=UPI0025DF06CA|nr:helix-turn-helix domain-containing protein [Treponema sp.]MCR5217300.1 AraC family transcriptional regulator [Treponema sp.]